MNDFHSKYVVGFLIVVIIAMYFIYRPANNNLQKELSTLQEEYDSLTIKYEQMQSDIMKSEGPLVELNSFFESGDISIDEAFSYSDYLYELFVKYY